MKKFFFIAVFALSTLGFIPRVGNAEAAPTKVENKVKTKQQLEGQALMLAVKKKIKDLGIEHPDIVYYQFREESGNGTSRLYKTQNNLFGMKYPTKRKTTAIRKGSGGYSVYKSWESSVLDYKYFQDAYMKGLTRAQYLKKLRGSYSGKQNYLKNYL